MRNYLMAEVKPSAHRAKKNWPKSFNFHNNFFSSLLFALHCNFFGYAKDSVSCTNEKDVDFLHVTHTKIQQQQQPQKKIS